jgi:hypothetical protein
MFAIRNNVISWFEVSPAVSTQSILLSVDLIDYARSNLAI